MSAREDAGLILLVEDNDRDYQLIEIALRKKRFNGTIFRVPDARRAIAYLQGRPPFDDRAIHPLPSRICTELRLPVTTGYELIEWIRQRPEYSAIPIVVFSGMLSPELNRWLPGTQLCAGKSSNFTIYAELLLALLTVEPGTNPV